MLNLLTFEHLNFISMREISESNVIKAVGNFLIFYESDLKYIQRFQDFMSTEKDTNYFSNSDYSFTAFIKEFKIIRNISKAEQEKVLKMVRKWCLNANCDEVDKLAEKIKKADLSHGNLPLSFSSKILFLNNPGIIFPLDGRAKVTLKSRNVNYETYSEKVEEFKIKNKSVIEYCLVQINEMAETIENNFKGIKTIKKIRKNRMIDKLLWSSGGVIKE